MPFHYLLNRLSTKIAIPFCLLLVCMSLIGTFGFGLWFSRSLEDGARGELESVSYLLRRNVQDEADYLRLEATLIADSDALRLALARRDEDALNQQLMPMKAATGLDLLKVVDKDGTALVDLRDQSLSGNMLGDDTAVKRVIAGMQLADLAAVEGQSRALLVGFAPVKSADGLIGGVIVGTIFGNNLLDKIGAGTRMHLVALNRGQIIGTTLPDARIAFWERPSPESPPVRLTINGQDYIGQSVALSLQQARTGLSLVVLSSVTPLDEAKRVLWTRLGGFLLLAILITAIIGAIVARAVARPLEALTQVAGMLASGNLTARATVTSRDEIGDLGRAFNAMAAQIEERDKGLSSALQHMEQGYLELEESHNQLRRLQEFGTTLTANLDLEDVLARLGKAILDIFDGSCAWILTISPNRERLEGKSFITRQGTNFVHLPELFSTGEMSAAVPLKADSNLLAQVALGAQPRFITDVARLTEEEASGVFGRKPRGQTVSGAVAVIPLFLGGEPAGVVALAKDRAEEFKPLERATMMLFCNHAASAIKNARLYHEVKRLGEVDSLTQLYNHGTIELILKRMLDMSRRYDLQLSLMMVDLDNFKLLNDTYGHPSGDEVLRQIARALEGSCRSSDIIGRYGGDEFMVILPETTTDEAGRVALRFIEQLAAEHVVTGEKYDIPISCSIGVASYPLDSEDPEGLIRAADAAMYDAKRTKDGSICLARARAEDTPSVECSSWGMLDYLITAVDNKDRYTRRHSDMVTEYSLALAREMRLPPAIEEQMRIAGPLHDVGKICMPDSILRKPGPLTDEERQVVEQHPLLGALMVQQIPHLEDVLDGIRHHHERYDGRGYPNRLAAKGIPLLARLLAVADAYSAMVTDRPYRKALTTDQAMAQLLKGAGSQFDPEVVQAFVNWLQREQVNSEKRMQGASASVCS